MALVIEIATRHCSVLVPWTAAAVHGPNVT